MCYNVGEYYEFLKSSLEGKQVTGLDIDGNWHTYQAPIKLLFPVNHILKKSWGKDKIKMTEIW